MKLIVEVEIEKQADWEDDGTYLYIIPQFGGFTETVYLTSQTLRTAQGILQKATETDKEAPWVITSVKPVDSAQQE